MPDDQGGQSVFTCPECKATIRVDRKTGNEAGHKNTCTLG